MTQIQKSQWVADGDKLSLHVDFNKVDKENRMVYGFATLDNVDQAGDQITREANRDAFSKFRGNLREMHSEIAAGRVVDYGEESYVAPDGNTYTGIFVKSYVSKGAPNTWEKVLDGTLTGFSIGGKIVEQSNKLDKALGKTVRVIEKYNLAELSLVDTPCNQFANVLSVQKSDEGTFFKGMAADVEMENIFWCGTDELAKSSTNSEEVCNNCGSAMTNIGQGEVVKGVNTDIDDVVMKHVSTETSGGGVRKMSESTEAKEETTEVAKAPDEDHEVEGSVVTSDEVAESDKKDEDKDKESETVSEEVNTDQSLEKMLDKFKTDVTAEVNKGHEATTEVVKKFEGQIEDFKKSYEEKFDDLNSKIEDFSKTLDGYKSETADVVKRLAAVEDQTAIKKSADVEITKAAGNSEKSDNWNGAFLGLNGIED